MIIPFDFGLEIVRVTRQIKERNLQPPEQEMVRMTRMKAMSQVSKGVVEGSAEAEMITTVLLGIQIGETMLKRTILFLD